MNKSAPDIQFLEIGFYQVFASDGFKIFPGNSGFGFIIRDHLAQDLETGNIRKMGIGFIARFIDGAKQIYGSFRGMG